MADKQKLHQDLIRIHVVANSDSPKDQSIKLSVRDAVLESLKSEMEKISDPEMARQYLQEKLPYIQSVASHTLRALGCSDLVTVKLQQESFGRSENLLFSLPAGIYQSLRITIGEGQGQNWWSVVFPDMVFSKEKDVGSLPVFSESSGNKRSTGELKIRFLLLDLLGKLENNFFTG